MGKENVKIKTLASEELQKIIGITREVESFLNDILQKRIKENADSILLLLKQIFNSAVSLDLDFEYSCININAEWEAGDLNLMLAYKNKEGGYDYWLESAFSSEELVEFLFDIEGYIKENYGIT